MLSAIPPHLHDQSPLTTQELAQANTAGRSLLQHRSTLQIISLHRGPTVPAVFPTRGQSLLAHEGRSLQYKLSALPSGKSISQTCTTQSVAQSPLNISDAPRAPAAIHQRQVHTAPPRVGGARSTNPAWEMSAPLDSGRENRGRHRRGDPLQRQYSNPSSS